MGNQSMMINQSLNIFRALCLIMKSSRKGRARCTGDTIKGGPVMTERSVTGSPHLSADTYRIGLKRSADVARISFNSLVFVL